MPRKPKVSREQVHRAALAIIDQEGLEALSMRRLGESLSVEAMSIYNHVPNKAAVLDGVFEAVLDEIKYNPPTGEWMRDIRDLADGFRRALRAHPNVLPLFATRPAVTRSSLRQVETALALLANPFPDMRDRIYAFQTLATYVVGNSMAQFTNNDEVDRPSYENLPADNYPMLTEAAPIVSHYDSDDEFAFGLDALLNGLAAKSKAATR